MKKPNLLKSGLTILVVAGVLFSCSKQDDIKTPSNALPAHYGSSAKLHSSLENEDDKDDEDMNDNLYMLATAFLQIAKDEDLMQDVYDEAANNPDHCVKYADLIALNDNFLTILNTELSSKYCPDPLGSVEDPYAAISASMVYNEIEYFPTIYIVNLNTMNSSLFPYVSVGAEINDDDAILAYQLDVNDDIVESTLTESQALAKDNPVVIFTNGTDHIEDVENESPTLSSVSDQNNAAATDEIWKWDEVTIHPGYRYEGKGKSDVRCLTTFADGNGNYLSGNGSFVSGVEESLIKKITANDIANNVTQTNVNSDVFPTAGTVSTTNLVYYFNTYLTTFEYDWYASPKTVASCGNLYSINGFQHAPRMKYSNEWYHNSICDITVHGTWLNYANATFSFGNSKSLTKIKRTQ